LHQHTLPGKCRGYQDQAANQRMDVEVLLLL